MTPDEQLPEQPETSGDPREPATPPETPAEQKPPEQPAGTTAPEPQSPPSEGRIASSETEAKPAAPRTERPARPAREAEAKEAPRNPPPPGSINEVLAAACAGVEMKAYMVPAMVGENVAVEVSRDDLPRVLTAARDEGLTYLRSLSGVDWQDEGLEVVYHLASLEKKHYLIVKTRVSYDDAVVPSAVSSYPAADWHERETRDMFGITFDGHPDLVPLLLPDDMTDHFPLRKDNPLQEIEEWQGDNLREGAGEGDEE
jgi:NADH:ubiquinone oxidoreductase subunit C